MPQSHRTYCRNCTAACGLVVETQGREVLSVRGDRDHPMTQGYMCIKGAMSGEWHNGEDRLLTAMKRRPAGDHAPVENGQAFDEIAARLTDILERYGPRSVALYFGTGAKMNTLGVMALRSFLLNTIGSPYLYSSSTIDQSAKWVTAGRMGAFSTGKPVIYETEVTLVVGSNPAVSHAGLPTKPFPSNNPMHWVRQYRKQGQKFIVIDPRRTEFARQADIHLQLIPGEDVTLLAGMIHAILANGWEDKAFCERFVTSLDTLKQAVADFTPEYAAARAGVPVDQLIEAARLFATASCRSASTGTGPDMSPRSNLSEHMAECLNAICGAYRRPGDQIRNVGSFSRRTRCVEGVRPPHRSWEQGPNLWTEDSGVVSGEYPTSRLPNEILDGGIRALFVVGGNIATALGHPEKTLAALDKLDLLVTLDPRMSQTAHLSHYAVPVKLPYERYDATHFFDGFFLHPFAQIATPLVEAPPGVLDEWEVFWEIARRMGRKLTLAEYKWGAGPTDSTQLELDMQEKPTGEALMRWLCDQGSVSFEEMARHPEGVRFDVEPLVIEKAQEDDGARLDVCPPDVAEELRAARAETPDSAFRYRLASRRMIETMNSAFRDASETRRRWPLNPAFMNPADMSREGLHNGDPIFIASEHGRIVGRAQEDPNLRPGVISMSHQWGSLDPSLDPLGEAGGFTGRLVSLDHDVETINYMPRFSGIPVNVAPAG